MVDWIKLHRRAEKELTRILRRYFKAQNKRLLSAIRQSGTLPGISFLTQDDERKSLIEAIDDTMLGIMGAGAYHSWKSVPTTKAFSITKLIQRVLPKVVIDALKAVWERIKGLLYWGVIASGQEERAKKIIADGLADGRTAAEIEAALKKELAAAAITRAAAIATSEATMALGAGAQAALNELKTQGKVAAIIWRTKGDPLVRPSHVALEGAEMSAEGTFDVGGHSAAYPGDPALPAEERAGCRCRLAAD